MNRIKACKGVAPSSRETAHLTFAKIFAIIAPMKTKGKGKRGKREAFKLSHFTNPSGERVWRVSGTTKDGKRIRENFKTEAEAETRKGNLTREDLNMPAVPMMPTTLTAPQLEIAKIAFDRAAGHNLLDILDYYFENYRPAEIEITLRAAVDKFLAEKERENRRDRTMENLKSRLDSLVEHFPTDKKVSEVLPGQLKEFLYRDKDRSPISVRNDFLVVRPFFKWCAVEKYCPTNPAANIGKIKFDVPPPVALPVADVKKLLDAAIAYHEGKCVPYFVLATFCAIRPREISRLSWDNIDLAQKVIVIPRTVAKTRSNRNIELADNVLAWLKPYAADKTPLNITRRAFEAVRKNAALGEWQGDVLRHTAVSNHLAEHKDAARTALWAGHTENVLHRDYKYLLTAEQAKAFWAVYPQKAGNVLDLAQAAKAIGKSSIPDTNRRTPRSRIVPASS